MFSHMKCPAIVDRKKRYLDIYDCKLVGMKPAPLFDDIISPNVDDKYRNFLRKNNFLIIVLHKQPTLTNATLQADA